MPWIGLKLADKTIVVFFGDHGYHLGEKGKWSKHNSLFEVAARVPLVDSVCRVRPPNGPGLRAGRCSLSTSIRRLGWSCAVCRSRRFVRAQPGKPAERSTRRVSHPAFYGGRNAGTLGRSVRTQRWRYSEWDNGQAGAVLFDHDKDRHEMTKSGGRPAIRQHRDRDEIAAGQATAVGRKIRLGRRSTPCLPPLARRVQVDRTRNFTTRLCCTSVT